MNIFITNISKKICKYKRNYSYKCIYIYFVLRKPSLSLHCENLRILATKIVWNMWKYPIGAVIQNRIEIIGIEKQNVNDWIEKKWMSMTALQIGQLTVKTICTTYLRCNIQVVDTKSYPCKSADADSDSQSDHSSKRSHHVGSHQHEHCLEEERWKEKIEYKYKCIEGAMVLASRASGCLFGHPKP